VSAFDNKGFAPPSPLAHLQIHVDAPAEVRAGETLRYTVTLTNPTPRDIPLSECPNYREMILFSPREAKGLFQLNCASLHGSIGAGTSVRFAMVLSVPTGFMDRKPKPTPVTGFLPATLDWTFLPAGFGPVADVPIRVVSR
jgi:hypothetical protein